MAPTPRRLVIDQWQTWWSEVIWTCFHLYDQGESLIALASDTQERAMPTGGHRSSTEVARPTELAALANLLARCPRCSVDDHEVLVSREDGACPHCGLVLPHEDLVAVWLSELFGVAAEMRAASSRIDRLAYLIEHRADGRVGRQSSLQGPCLSCDRTVAGTTDDRLRGGLCDMCRKRRERWAEGRADQSVAAYLIWLDHERRKPAEHGHCPRPSCRQPMDGTRWCPRCGCEVERELHA